MEVLVAIVALFVLIAFPIAILAHLSGIRKTLDRIADAAESKPRAETAAVAEPKPREEVGPECPPALPPVAARAEVRADARPPSPAKPPVIPAASGETPPEPTKLGQWTAAAWDWLRVGEAWRPGWIPGEYAVAAVQLLRAAALLLIFGAAWFVRYVHEQGWFSPAGRVAAGFAAAAALVAGGAALLRRRYRPVGLALAGVGFALGEFVDWAGANLYGVLPAPTAFAVAAALALGAGAMAWRGSSLLLALVALFAGYTAPLFFPEAVRGGGDAPLLAWLLVLAAEAAVLATARGWRSLPWISFPAGFALGLREGAGAAAAATVFHAAHWTLANVQCLGHAFRRRAAPFWFERLAWLAATAVSAVALAASAGRIGGGFLESRAGWPLLGLAAGSAGVAAAFRRRGVLSPALAQCLLSAAGALWVGFLCLSPADPWRSVFLAATATCFAALATRGGGACAAILAAAAWCFSLSAGFDAPLRTPAARLARLGPAVAALWASGLAVRRRADGEAAPSPAPAILLWGAWGATLAWCTFEVRDAFPDAAPALALFWSAFALATLVAGLRCARRDVRGAALCLFGLAAAKFLFFDQAGAPTPERVAGFLGVGLLLLLGSAVYIRSSAREKNQ